MPKEDNFEILEKLIMRTMNSVDNLATKVAEINTTLNDSVLDDNKLLKERANRHSKKIDDLTRKVEALENSKKYIRGTLIVIGTIITTFILPIVAIIVGTL